MEWLIAGIIVWFVAHGFKALFPKLRAKITERLGEEKSRSPFATGILIAFILIIYGWRHADSSFSLYDPSPVLLMPGILLMVLAFYSFIASTAGVRLLRWNRHPQLSGMFLWGIGHLMTNGEVRSVILFGGLSVWALTLMPLINKRDGAFTRLAPANVKTEWKYGAITAVVCLVAAGTHGLYTAIWLIHW